MTSIRRFSEFKLLGTTAPQKVAQVSEPKTQGPERGEPVSQPKVLGLQLPIRPPSKKIDVGIVGAGPTGLAAAITLHQQGYRNIVVWEKRDCSYTRPVHFNVRAEFLNQLRELGVYNSLFRDAESPSGAITQLTFVNDISGQVQRRRGDSLSPFRTSKSESCLKMLEQPSVAQVRLADLEKALYSRATALGIKIVKRADVQVQDTQRGHVLVKHDGTQANYRANLVIIADGANSPTRKQAGVEVSETGNRAYFISGLVNRSVGPTLTRRVTENKHGEIVRQICVGHANARRSWVLVQVPPRKLDKLSDPEEARKYYVKHANRVLRKARLTTDSLHLGSHEVLEGGTKPFDVTERLSRQAVNGRCMTIGDAVGNAHFLTSGGINTAFAWHLDSLKDFLGKTNLSLRYVPQRGRKMSQYENSVLAATRDWLTISAQEFVGIAPVNFGRDFSQESQPHGVHPRLFNRDRLAAHASLRRTPAPAFAFDPDRRRLIRELHELTR